MKRNPTARNVQVQVERWDFLILLSTLYMFSFHCCWNFKSLSSLIFTQCDGYSILHGDPNPSYGKCAVVEPINSIMVILPNPIFDTRGSDQERRCYDFFLNRTASQLSGFWDSDFWGCLIHRATHHQPAIRHAVLALGSLHERFEAGDKSVVNPIWDKREGGFALQQYNQAIQHLIKPASKDQQAVDVCLIACILFACFEVSTFLYLHQIFGEDGEKERNPTSVTYT